MPLTRLNNSAFDAQSEGVYFGMWNGSTSVRCFVSHEALTDKAQGSGQAESLDVFHEYRSEIENLASDKYDAGKIIGNGILAAGPSRVTIRRKATADIGAPRSLIIRVERFRDFWKD